MYYEEYKLTQNYQDLVRAGYSDDEIYNAFRIKSGDVHEKYQEYKTTDNYKQLVDAGYNDGQILSAFNQKWEQRERTPRETSIEAAEAQVRESQKVYVPEERPVEISDVREDFKTTTKIEPIEDQLYRAISQAETGPYTDKWIRNEVNEASSAYGPAQITYSLARDYLNKKKELFTAEEQAYLNKFVEQGKKFINKGTGKYALGGSGDLTSDNDKMLYESVAKKMLIDHYNNAGEDLEKTWNMWRFGPKGGTDERYQKEFMAEMEKAGKEVGRSYMEDQAIAETLFAGEGTDIVETKPVPEKEKGVLDRFSANVGIAVGGVIQKIFGSEVEAAERFYDAKDTYDKIGEEGFVKRLGIYFPTKETKEKYSAEEIAKAGYYLEERKNEEIYAQILPESQALVEAGKEVVAEELTNLIDTYEQSAERAMNGFVSRAWTRGDLTDAIEQGVLIAVNSGATEEANKLIDLRKEITEQLAGDPDANFIERTGDALIGMIPFMGKRAAYSMIPVVGTGLAAGASAAQGGGGVYADLMEAGADEETAKVAANIAGVAYSAVEKMQLDELTTLSKGGVDQVKKGILAKIVDFAKQRGLSALKEATEESVQAIITEGTVETIKEIEGLDDATVLERIGSVASQAAQEGIQSLATFGLLETVKGAGGAFIAKPTAEQEIAQDVQVEEEAVEDQPSAIVEDAVQVVEEQAKEQLVEPQTDAAEELRQKLLDTVLTDEEKQIIAEARTQKAQEDALETQEAQVTEEEVTEVVEEPKEAEIASEEVEQKALFEFDKLEEAEISKIDNEIADLESELDGIWDDEALSDDEKSAKNQELHNEIEIRKRDLLRNELDFYDNHWTANENLVNSEPTGEVDPKGKNISDGILWQGYNPGERGYSYAVTGDFIYSSQNGESNEWTNAKAGGTMTPYSFRRAYKIDDTAKIKTINSPEEADSFAKELGYDGWTAGYSQTSRTDKDRKGSYLSNSLQVDYDEGGKIYAEDAKKSMLAMARIKDAYDVIVFNVPEYSDENKKYFSRDIIVENMTTEEAKDYFKYYFNEAIIVNPEKVTKVYDSAGKTSGEIKETHDDFKRSKKERYRASLEEGLAEAIERGNENNEFFFRNALKEFDSKEEEITPLPEEQVVVEEERVEKEEKRESKRKKINKERKERETEEREQREEVVLKDSARSTIVRTNDGITKTFKATKKQPAKVADLIDNEIKGYDRAGDIAPKVTTRTEDGYVMEDIGDNAVTPETLSDKDVEDIAVVVNKLHEERGVSHGDLHLGDGKNPSNIYRDNDGNIRVLDFERASFAEDDDFDVDVAEELRDFVDTVVPEDKREKFIEAYGRDLFETRMASIEEEADVAEKVAEKPVEPRKEIKPTKVTPKEEIELRKPLMASFTKSVSAIPGVKIDKAELDQGRLVAQVVVPTETGTETKSIVIPDDIAGNKKEIKELIEEEKSKTKAPEITTEFTKEQEAVILSKVAENFGAKKPFGRGDKRRKEIESMSRADFKNYLSESKRLGESINILSDQAIDKLQAIAADYGKSAIARLNKKDVFEATDMDIREYGRTEEKLAELNKIVEDGSIEYNPENEDHKRWVKSKVVDTQVTSDLSVKQMSDAVAKMGDKDFSEEQIQTMIDISQGESVSYVPRIHDKLVENGLVSVELLEGTAKAKGSSETRFATTKRGLEVGAGAVAKATSLDVTGDLAKFSQEGEDEANIDYTEVDIRDVPQEDEAGDIVSQSIGEVSSSWGLFNRKGVGKGEEQKVEIPRLRRPTGVDGTTTVSRNRIESAYNLLLSGFTKEELENYGVPAVLYDGSLPDKYAIPNEMLWRMNQLAQSLPESTFSKEAIEEQINKLGYFEGFYTSQSAKADKKHINKIVNDLKTSNDPRKMTMGTFIEGIVNATNISNFNLSVEALDGAMGFYSAIDNSIIVDETIDGALALSHEIGHWAYNNLLSIKEKRELLIWFKNTYMDKDGDLNVRKLADTFPSLDMAGENVFDNINEVFAEMFSQYIIKDKLPQQIAKQPKSIFDKVKNLFKYVWETLKGTKAIDPMFRQYIDLALARAASEKELAELSEMGTVQEYAFQNPVNAKGKKEKETVGWSDGKDRKARRENAIANAVIEQSIAELDKHIEEGKELTVDQLRNHFIDFIVYNMPEGPIRKNMLKTVMSIKSPDPRDPAYKHAVKVVKRYEEAIQRDELMKGIRKMLKPSKYAKLLSEGRKFVQDIVDNYDLQKMQAATREKLGSKAWELFNNDPKMADTKELQEYSKQTARLLKMPLRDVPLTTLREIHDELQEVYASDKAEKKAIKEGKVRSRLEAEQELVNELNSKPEQMTEEQLKAERGVTKVYSRRFKELFKRGLSTFANAETTINLLDSGNKGGFYNNVMLPVVRGADEALRYSQQATDSMVKYLKETGVNITNWSEHQHSGLANVGYKKEVLRDTHILGGRGVQLTKMEQVALLRTLGDEDGLRHVINGGIVVKAGKDRLDLKPNIRELNTFLQNVDEDIITVAGAFDKYYLDEGHYLDNFVRETTGGSVDVKEKHQPLIVADARVNKESAEFMSLHEINNRMKTRTFKKGSTKERIKSSKGAIVIEDMLATQQRTAHEAGTFVGYSTTIPFVENVLKGVSKDMEKHGLKVEHQLLTNWINQIGAPDPVVQVSPNVSKAYNTMRKMFITGALGFKASTSLIQTVSAGNYLAMVDDMGVRNTLSRSIPRFVAQNMAAYTANIKDDSELNEEMFKHSPMIRERFESSNIDRDIGETGNQANTRRVLNQLVDKTASRKVKDVLNLNTPMAPISFMDKVAIKSIWDAAKMEANITGHAGDMDWVADRAEEVIRVTQPTFSTMDKPEILRNAVLKELTMFASQRSKYVNMTYRALGKISRGDTAQGVADLLWIGIAVPVAINSIKEAFNAFRGTGEEDEDIATWLVKKIIDSNSSNFAVVGDVVSSIINERRLKPGGALAGQMTALSDYAQALSSGDSDRIFTSAVRTAKAFGLPAGIVEVGEILENMNE